MREENIRPQRAEKKDRRNNNLYWKETAFRLGPYTHNKAPPNERDMMFAPND
jgi:hypothetical protein